MKRARRTRLARWGGALVVLSLALPGAACTLLTSLNGLTGGPSDGGAEADSPFVSPDSSATPDAGGDAPVTPPADGAAEAQVDAADGSALLFYDDFDEPPSDPADAAALNAPWDQVTSLGAKASRNGALYVSSPYSMLVQTVAAAHEVDCAGYKSFPTAATTGTYDLAFEIYVEVADTTASSDAVLTAFELLDSAGTRWALQLEVSDTTGNPTLDFSENGTAADGGTLPFRDHFASEPLPVGAWTLVTMEINVADADGPTASTNTATLAFGSNVVATAALQVGTVNGTPEILVGFTYAAPSSAAWTVRYDNVSLTYR